jgi:hypothetical protein
VTLNYKNSWFEERERGNLEAPDLNDFELIQEAALKNEYPILLINIYEYQNQTDMENIYKNQDKFFDDLYGLLNNQIMVEWFEKGLYNGDWIKDGLEEILSESYNINFTHENLPIADIKYESGKDAIFQLDGYDSKRKIGYKFVTVNDLSNWTNQRIQGNLEAPDISKSKQIKEAALEYDFPVLFIYVPDYWKTNISYIFNNELSEPLNMNANIKKWLEEHK